MFVLRLGRPKPACESRSCDSACFKAADMEISQAPSFIHLVGGNEPALRAMAEIDAGYCWRFPLCFDPADSLLGIGYVGLSLVDCRGPARHVGLRTLDVRLRNRNRADLGGDGPYSDLPFQGSLVGQCPFRGRYGRVADRISKSSPSFTSWLSWTFSWVTVPPPGERYR